MPNAEIARNIQVLSDKKILSYPTSLGVVDKDAYGREEQYVIIRINTDEKSTMLRTDKSLGQTVVTNGRTGIGVATRPYNLTKNTDEATRIKYGDEAVKNEKWLTQKGMQSLDRVIVLPMPNEHSVRTAVSYNPEFDTTDLTILGDTLNQKKGEIASGLLTKLKTSFISGLVNKTRANSTNSKALLAEDRKAANPRKEVMFGSFGFRKQSFNYVFAPKDQEESEMVRSIIETFRYYALPEIIEAKMFYLFPAEFEVSFMLGQKDNPHIPRMATSVLQNVNVNYTPNSMWASLPNGAPLSLSLTLDFIELELIDRTRVFNKNSAITSGY